MPQTLDDYLAQFNPTETPEQKRARVSGALMAAGFGLLGTRKGQELPSIGRAGLLGMTSYNQSGRDQVTEAIRKATARNQAIQSFMQEQALREQQQAKDVLRNFQMPSAQSTAMAGMPDLAPTPQNAAILEARKAMQGTQMPTNVPDGMLMPEQQARKFKAQADALRKAGLVIQADAYEAKAMQALETGLKFRDENQSMQTVIGPDGKPVLIQPRKYGMPQQLPYQPTPKTHYADIGGAIRPINEYTNVPGADIPKTMTYSDKLARERLAFDQKKQAAEGGPGAKTAFANANQLRDEFNRQATPFITVRDAYRRMVSAYDSAKTDESGAADIALLFGYMKTLDPGSTVREGEFATAQNSGGVPGWVISHYNKALNGQLLSGPMRENIKKTADSLYQKAESAHRNTEEQYRSLAKRNKIDPENVIINYRVRDDAGTSPVPQDVRSRADAILAGGR